MKQENKFEESPKRENEVGRLFGDKAKALKDGDLIKVTKDSVEGRDIAVLTRVKP